MRRLLSAATMLAIATALPAAAQDLEAGEAAFRKCTACHAIGEGAAHKLGPVLNDVLGRTAGTAEGYAYSQSMIGAGTAGLVWTPQTLDQFLSKPREFIVGTKMTFAGIANEAERENIIAYLMTFSPGYEAPPKPGDKIGN